MAAPQYFFKFEKCVSLDEIASLRNQYLDKLIEPQELYLELMVRTANVFAIILNGAQIGYFLINEKATLVEFFVVKENIDLADKVFSQIVAKFSICKALCKSFDHTLLSCCVGLQHKTSVLGILCREFKPSSNNIDLSSILVRPATSEDEWHIIEINEEVFDHDYEVLEYINKKQLLIFEKDHTTIGFGIFSRVIEGRQDFDIGMLVDKNFRGQGLGRLIISYLANYCAKNGWRPIAGCAVNNIGSRRCLEKAGFVAGYRLLEFDFQS